MKQQNLLTKMLLLFALVVGSVTSVWAENQDVVFNFLQNTESYGWSGTPAASSDLTVGDVFTNGFVTFTYTAKGSGTTHLRWWSTGDGLRSYKGNKFKIATSVGTIEKITIEGTCVLVETTSTGGSLASNRNWTKPETGGVTKVEFECNQSSGNKTIKKITVTIALPESSDPSSDATFAETEPSINFPGTTTYSQEVTTATSYTGKVTYEITANTAGATIEGSTVTVTQEGSVTVKATAPAVTGFAASTASYTLTVNDTRSDNGLAFDESSQNVKIGDILTAPTLTNPNGLTVSYSSGNNEIATVDEGGNVTGVAAGTTTITASFEGNDVYKAGSASYTIEVYDPNAKGTIYNPYTADEVIAGETGTDVYVIGYIVGGFNSSNKFTTTASDYQNSNFAIATSPTESDDTKVVPIQVQGTFQTSFGLKGKSYNAGVAKVLIKGDLERYFSRPGVKNVEEISKVAEVVNISSAGMATYYTDCALDFTDFNDMYAYVATTEGTTINYKRVKKVPTKTAVLLRNPNETSASHDVPVITEGAETVSDNQFVGTLTQIESLATEGGSNSTNYILNNGSNGVGFYWANGQTVGVHRAYLNVPAGVSAPFLGFNEDEGTTSINSIERTINDNQYYDLSGHRVAQPTKGVFIVNGKKVVIK